MRLFVTGATGFIGSHFLDYALKQGHQVTALRRSPSSEPCIPLPVQPVWLVNSLSGITESNLAGHDALIHLAAAGVTPQPATWESCYQTNLIDSLNLVRCAAPAGIRRVVVTGTYAEYGRSGLRYDPIPPDAPLEPSDIYAASKASASIALAALARTTGLELSYARLFSAYGEGQHPHNFWPQLRAAALSGQDFPMTEGSQIRDFLPVTEAARLLLHEALRSDIIQGQPRIFNLASGHPVSLLHFAQECWKSFSATGQLLPGSVPTRPNEVSRYVPLVTP
jgi:nucleoside-diphosphate-sugar epimerase